MILLPEIKDPIVMLPTGALTLAGAATDYNIDVHDFTAYRSVINGHLSIVSRGEFFEGSIDIFNANKVQYGAIKGLVGNIVRLWPFGAGEVSLNPLRYYPYVDVLIKTAVPYHKNNALYVDAIIITFASVDPYTVKLAGDTGIVIGPDT